MKAIAEIAVMVTLTTATGGLLRLLTLALMRSGKSFKKSSMSSPDAVTYDHCTKTGVGVNVIKRKFVFLASGRIAAEFRHSLFRSTLAADQNNPRRYTHQRQHQLRRQRLAGGRGV